MYFNKHTMFSSVCGLTVAFALPAAAQDDGSEPSTNQTQITNQPGAEDDTSRTFGQPLSEDNNSVDGRTIETRRPITSDRSSNELRSETNSQRGYADDRSETGRYRMSPEGWVKIGVDYDNDGRFDAFRTISVYELEKAEQASLERSRHEQNNARRDRSQISLTGKVQEMSAKAMLGEDHKKVVAKVQSNDGQTMNVCLGPENKVNELGIQQGSEVQIEGVRARVNGKEHVMAETVSFEGNSIENDIPAHRGLMRFKGEIQQTRKANFRGHDSQFVIAQVKSSDRGNFHNVNLGPADKFDGMELKEGTEIRVLGHRGRLNDEPAVIAEHVRINDKTIDVRPDQKAMKKHMKDEAHKEKASEKDEQKRDAAAKPDGSARLNQNGQTIR